MSALQAEESLEPECCCSVSEHTNHSALRQKLVSVRFSQDVF